jgi:predicted PurR-regulated permease PerM
MGVKFWLSEPRISQRVPPAEWAGTRRGVERPMAHPRRSFEDNVFLILLVLVTLAFAWVLWPFSGAVLWATTLAIVFFPIYRRLNALLQQRHNLAAFATLLIIVLLFILPLTVIMASLVQEASSLFASFQLENIDLNQHFQQTRSALPDWAVSLLDRFGLSDLSSVQQQLSSTLTRASQFLARQAINIGQVTLDFMIGLFVMLYLLFFFLRDGEALAGRIRQGIPMRDEQQRALINRFTVAIRATVKGDVVVALLQGTLGGVAFWFLGIRAALLWGAVMAILSLLPAVGSALIWGPVAIYLLVTGSIWQGVILLIYGVLVISLVDNIVRPALVAKDTRMPDYIVLLSTVGALATLGLNGFIIGPVVAAMFIAAWDIFGRSRERIQADGAER